MNKEFKITWEMVEKSDCGYPDRCVLANAFGQILPKNIRVLVNFSPELGHWYFWVLSAPGRPMKTYGDFPLPDELAEVAHDFDDYGESNKLAFFKRLDGEVFEYPDELIRIVEKMYGENNNG